jgi:lysylphosphatidylglycerol synthetase-like protein (DUF2156 family)
MKDALAKLLRGAPALIGVLVGIALYAQPAFGQPAPTLPAVLLIAVAALRHWSQHAFERHPRLAMVLLEPWSLAAVCAVALSTQFLLWFALMAPSLFQQTGEEAKLLSGALVGAVTTFLATAWTKDVQDAEGPLLPATQFKAFARTFLEQHQIVGDRVEVEAADADKVPGKNISGWGFKARWQRAGVLGEYLDASKPVAKSPR